MKKGVFLILLFFSAFLFTGCLDGTISCGVDADKRAFLQYDAAVDLSEIPEAYKTAVIDAVDSLAEEYEKMDFTVKQEILEDQILLDMEYAVQEESYAAAFAALRQMLTDENITPFVRTELAEDHTDFEQYFSFEAQVNPESIVKTVRANELPKDLREMFEGWVDTSGFTLNVMLPGHTYTSENEVTMEPDNVCCASQSVKLEEEASIGLSTRFSLENGEIAEQTAKKQIQKFSMIRNVFLGAAGLLAVAAVVLIISIVKRKKTIH